MQFATAALQILNLKKMKKLSRDEMKKVMGGNAPDKKYTRCCIGTECTSCSDHSQCGSQATETTTGCEAYNS